MKAKLFILSLVICCGLVSCRKDPPVERTPERTIFVYMPWSTNLLPNFRKNLEDLEASIVAGRIQTDRFIVFLSESSTEASLFELKYENGSCTQIPLKTYVDPSFTTATGITAILRDAVSYSSTAKYAMIIGSHGLGWIPVSPSVSRSADFRPHWDAEGSLTRYFGGTSPRFQTDITTLAQGIADAGLSMEYILFDDCYMSNVESAYELKEVTDYLIGCPTEVMRYGFPYHLIGEHLTGTVDCEGVVKGFYQFYSNYQYPYGTVAVTDCSELEALAAVMREINRNYPDPLSTSQISKIQRMDGYTPVVFFDLGDYVARLCDNSTLLARFEAQLERAVPGRFKRNTRSFPAAAGSGVRPIAIDTYSGITVSDPSTHHQTATKTSTAWWKATHD